MSRTLKSFKRLGPAAICLAMAGILSGCASWRFQDNSPNVTPPSAAAPLGQVSQSELPPPGGMNVGGNLAGAAQPADAADLTPASVAGVWRANLGGITCQLATPQTKAGRGYRAGSLHCPAVFAQVGSWNINGKQLVFYDKGGKDLAVLYSTGANNFAGRTSAGMPVSLSR